MMKAFALFSLVVATAVSGAPLLFNADLLNKGHDHVAVVKHVAHVDGAAKVRFVHLVPKLAHVADVTGFASVAAAANAAGANAEAAAKHHAFLKVDAANGEALVELLGLADCATWHVALLGVFKAGALVHKAFAWVKGVDVKALGLGVDPLVGFLHGKLAKDHFKGLVKAGLPAHLLTHKLHVLFA